MKLLKTFFAVTLVSTTALTALSVPGMADNGHKAGGQKKMERMLEKFDMNSDGKLSQEEIDKSISLRFASIDADSDSKVTQQEFRDHLTEDKQYRSKRQFRRFDRNDDGAITEQEMKSKMAGFVARKDVDGDGFLSSDDGNWGRGDERGDRKGWWGKKHKRGHHDKNCDRDEG